MKSPMALIKTAFGRPAPEDVKFQMALRGYSPDDDYWYYPVVKETVAGVDVSEYTALQYTTVWACQRVISETIASLPYFVYRRLKSGGKEKATSHPAYKLLHTKPNSEMTSFQFREIKVHHILSWGNFYGQIIRDNGDVLQSIWPLRPDRMNIERKEGSDILQYKYRLDDGQTKVFDADEILHIPGLGFNGITGYSPIAMAREAIGIGKAAEDFAGRFFSNDVSPGGVLEHPNTLGEKGIENLKKSLMEAHSGLKNRWKPMILEEGMKWASVGMPLVDAQFLENRKFQRTEICSIYRVPPHLVMDLERATFSNIEQQSLDFVVNCIRPWLVRIEQAELVKLFTEDEQEEYFPEHLVDGMLRGDIQSRYSAYSIGRQWGWLSADDIRELENMNPLPGGQGKMYLVPLNMVSAKDAGKPPQTLEEKPDDTEEPMMEEDNMSEEERKELSMLRSFRIDAELKISDFIGRLAKFEDQKAQFETKISEKDAIIRSISDEKQREIDKLTAKVVSQDVIIVELRSEISSLKNQIKKFTGDGYNRLFEDAVSRVIRRETIAVKRALGRKDLASFRAYLDDFYKELPEFASNALQPPITSYAEMVGSTGATNCLSAYVSNHIRESREEINKWVGILIHDTTDFRRNEQGIDDSLSVWAERRPERAAISFQSFFNGKGA